MKTGLLHFPFDFRRHIEIKRISDHTRIFIQNHLQIELSHLFE